MTEWTRVTAAKAHSCDKCRRKTKKYIYVQGFFLICEDCYNGIKELKGGVK